MILLITNISSEWLAERAEPRRFWKLGVRFYQRGQKSKNQITNILIYMNEIICPHCKKAFKVDEVGVLEF